VIVIVTGKKKPPMPKFAVVASSTAAATPSFRWQVAAAAAAAGNKNVVDDGCQSFLFHDSTTTPPTLTTTTGAMATPTTTTLTTRFPRPNIVLVASEENEESKTRRLLPPGTAEPSNTKGIPLPGTAIGPGPGTAASSTCPHLPSRKRMTTTTTTTSTTTTFSVVESQGSSSNREHRKNIVSCISLIRLDGNPNEAYHDDDDDIVDSRNDVVDMGSTDQQSALALYWPCLAFDTIQDAIWTIQMLYDRNHDEDIQRLLQCLSLKYFTTLLSSDNDDCTKDNNNDDNNNNNNSMTTTTTTTTFAAVIALRDRNGCYPVPYFDIEKGNNDYDNNTMKKNDATVMTMAQNFHDYMNCLRETIVLHKDNPPLRDAFYEQLRLQQLSMKRNSWTVPNAATTTGKRVREREEREVLDTANGHSASRRRRRRPTKFQRYDGTFPPASSHHDDDASDTTTTNNNNKRGTKISTGGELEQQMWNSNSLMKRSTFTTYKGPGNNSNKKQSKSSTTTTSTTEASTVQEKREGKEKECQQERRNGKISTTTTTKNHSPRLTFSVAPFVTSKGMTTTTTAMKSTSPSMTMTTTFVHGQQTLQHKSKGTSPPKIMTNTTPTLDSTTTNESQSDSFLVIGGSSSRSSHNNSDTAIRLETPIRTLKRPVDEVVEGTLAMDYVDAVVLPSTEATGNIVGTTQSLPVAPIVAPVAETNDENSTTDTIRPEQGNDQQTDNEDSATIPFTIEDNKVIPKIAAATVASAQRRLSTGNKSVINVKFNSTGDVIAVASWRTVRDLLQELGHGFFSDPIDSTKWYYCRPYGNPHAYNNVQLGYDYFDSLEAYRAYLCANGVEYTGNQFPWTGQPNLIANCTIVDRWVRFAILGKARHHHEHQKKNKKNGSTTKWTTLPTQSMNVKEYHMSKSEALRALKVLGVKHKHSPLGDGYVLPGDEKQTIHSEEDLWAHLKRFGLPNECDYDKIDATVPMLTALELCIIRYVRYMKRPTVMDLLYVLCILGMACVSY
jgi:hypothetical protein